jgi:serine/threonine protein kinase
MEDTVDMIDFIEASEFVPLANNNSLYSFVFKCYYHDNMYLLKVSFISSSSKILYYNGYQKSTVSENQFINECLVQDMVYTKSIQNGVAICPRVFKYVVVDANLLLTKIPFLSNFKSKHIGVMVQEYIDGESLQYIYDENHEVINTDILVSTGAQILRLFLDCNVVHLDLTLSNIIYRQSNETSYIIDFGSVLYFGPEPLLLAQNKIMQQLLKDFIDYRGNYNTPTDESVVFYVFQTIYTCDLRKKQIMKVNTQPQFTELNEILNRRILPTGLGKIKRPLFIEMYTKYKNPAPMDVDLNEEAKEMSRSSTSTSTSSTSIDKKRKKESIPLKSKREKKTKGGYKKTKKHRILRNNRT